MRLRHWNWRDNNAKRKRKHGRLRVVASLVGFPRPRSIAPALRGHAPAHCKRRAVHPRSPPRTGGPTGPQARKPMRRRRCHGRAASAECFGSPLCHAQCPPARSYTCPAHAGRRGMPHSAGRLAPGRRPGAILNHNVGTSLTAPPNDVPPALFALLSRIAARALGPRACRWSLWPRSQGVARGPNKRPPQMRAAAA